MRSGARYALASSLVLAVAACGDDSDTPTTMDAAAPVDDAGPPVPLDYSDPSLWLCGPDALAPDHCLDADLSATRVDADGTTSVETHARADAPTFDCFYVYPTVDLDLIARNHDDFDDLEPMLAALRNQAARFSRVCRVWAPLYRQVTIGFYFGGRVQTDLFDLAYDDVESAFDHYLAQVDPDRRFLLFGHSQGAHHITRLIAERIEADDALRARMIAAFPIGARIDVPNGGLVGGTFSDTPLCTSAGENGCVIAYRTYAEGEEPEGRPDEDPAVEDACVDPAALLGAAALEGTYLSSVGSAVAELEHDPALTLDTPYVHLPDLYAAECVSAPGRGPWLRISIADPAETRHNPVPFDAFIYSATGVPGFGTHVLDVDFALGDLIALADAAARGP